MDTRLFLFAVLALLITPGPTNTLLALDGAAQGPRAALRLLPAELAGYLAAVIPLALLRLWVDPAAGPAGLALNALAAVWVAWLALRIGFGPATIRGTIAPVAPRTVLATTLMNPKVLAFALILLPAPADPAFPLHLALFAACVPLVGFGWTLFGSAVVRGAGVRAGLWLRRAAAVWLGVLALMLAQGAIA